MQIYTIFRKIASTHPQFFQHPKREGRNQTLEVRFEISNYRNFVNSMIRNLATSLTCCPVDLLTHLPPWYGRALRVPNFFTFILEGVPV